MSKCNQPNCGCNSPGQQYICYTTEPTAPCIGVNLTVNNTRDPNGYSDVNMVLEETNQISAYKEHLEFVNSPEPLSGLKRHVVLRLADKFLKVISNIFKGRNIGVGTSIYKGAVIEGTDTFQEFKRLKDSESIKFQGGPDDITAAVNQAWLQDQIDIPEQIIDTAINIGEEDGIGVYHNKIGNKFQFSRLKSPNGTVSIKKQADGTIYLDTVTTEFEYIKLFYVNPNYTGGDGNGSVIKPYASFSAAFNAVIGTGDIAHPQFPSAKIIIQSDTTTSTNPSIHNVIIHVDEGATLTYTGTDPYMFDTDKIYAFADKVGTQIAQNITINISGNGRFYRNTNGGMVNIVGCGEYSSVVTGYSSSYFQADSPIFKEYDHNSDPLFNVTILRGDNNPYADTYPGQTFLATTSSFTKYPLFKFVGRNFGSASTASIQGGITVISTIQTPFYIEDAIVTFDGDLDVQQNYSRVQYNGNTQYVDANVRIYLPQADRYMFHIKGESYLYVNKGFTIDRLSGHRFFGWNTIFYLDNTTGSIFSSISGKIKPAEYVENLVYMKGTSNSITLNTGNKTDIGVGNGVNIVNSDATASEDVSIYIPNTIIRRYTTLSGNVNTTVNINTDGTFSSTQSDKIQITNIPELASADYYLVYNSTTKEVGVKTIPTEPA